MEMIKLPPNSYCVIKNPVVLDKDGKVIMNEHGEAEVRFEEFEIRKQEHYPDPFPLYPYEELKKDVSPFTLLKDNEALVLVAVRSFFDERAKLERFIDDEYLFKGPGTYEPRVEEEIKNSIKAKLVLPNNALLLKALKDTTEPASGTVRKAGTTVNTY